MEPEERLPQVGDVLFWDQNTSSYAGHISAFGAGPFLVIQILGPATFFVTSLDGTPLKYPSDQTRNTNIFSMYGLRLDVFLTASRRACAETKNSKT